MNNTRLQRFPHPSSLRRTVQYASLLRNRRPCIRAYLIRLQPLSAGVLDEAFFTEAEITVFAYDDVIVNENVENTGRILQGPRKADIGL